MKSLCVSLEMAKKLKSAGWKKRTYFRYGPPWDSKDEIYLPTAEEVLRELPGELPDNSERDLVAYKHFGGWAVQYGGESLEEYETKEGESLSEAAAQMWMWCVEQGYIKP